MPGPIADSSLRGSAGFQRIKDSMLQDENLPLATAIDAHRWQAIFDKHKVDFGKDEDAVYTPAIVLWALLSQAFYKGEMRSCKAAVQRIAALWATRGKSVCSTNTGAYCRARSKLDDAAVRDIATHVASTAESAFDQQELDDEQPKHEVVSQVQETPHDGRFLLVDGFTVTASDTEENQEEYPQNTAQKEGLGFPVIRGVVLTSLITGAVIDMELGAYSGKQSGETALLWKMLDQLKPGDTLVADCFYCSYWLVAACRNKGVHIVMKNHDKRDDHPSGATRINSDERLTVWQRPPRPDWMSEQKYLEMPKELEVRLVDVVIDQPGFRSKQYTVATTMLDHQMHTRDWIVTVYRSRWMVELDIRSIKCTLGMDIIRAKTPAMVRTEIWSCILAYNLIRMKMLQTAAVNGRMPRTLSFATTMQMLATTWELAAVVLTQQLIQLGLDSPGSEQTGNRLDRVEPRANKRRPKLIALMTKPRAVLKQELIAAA